MMKKTWIAILISILVCLCLVFGIYKVNAKINTLSLTVRELVAERDEVRPRDSAAGRDEISLPDLDPHGAGYKVTQFGDVDQGQEMCYTITTRTGLVIVDGGYDYEAPFLREIIGQYGDHVDAWILTHPHPDHMTAFLDIYEDPQGIVIDHIYTVRMPDLDTLQSNASWDDYDTLKRFWEMDVREAEYPQAGDTLELLGLTVEILSVYDDKVDELSNDLMNDGSMMFRIQGERDSMLFCADVGVSMTDYLVAEYGARLKSDYVQMGHHGFGGPDERFYELASPKAVFFDAPAWLMESDTDRSTREKERLMRDMGCTIFSYYTAPNQIILQ